MVLRRIKCFGVANSSKCYFIKEQNSENWNGLSRNSSEITVVQSCYLEAVKLYSGVRITSATGDMVATASSECFDFMNTFIDQLTERELSPHRFGSNPFDHLILSLDSNCHCCGQLVHANSHFER